MFDWTTAWLMLLFFVAIKISDEVVELLKQMFLAMARFCHETGQVKKDPEFMDVTQHLERDQNDRPSSRY